MRSTRLTAATALTTSALSRTASGRTASPSQRCGPHHSARHMRVRSLEPARSCASVTCRGPEAAPRAVRLSARSCGRTFRSGQRARATRGCASAARATPSPCRRAAPAPLPMVAACARPPPRRTCETRDAPPAPTPACRNGPTSNTSRTWTGSAAARSSRRRVARCAPRRTHPPSRDRVHPSSLCGCRGR